MKKLYVIQKYVVASSISEALRIEKKSVVDEIWLDNDFKNNNKPQLLSKKNIGFIHKKNK